MAIASKSVTMTELGDDRAQAELVDLDAFIRTLKVEAGEDYADLAAFNSALLDHVLGHPTLAYEPEGHTTRKGKHTGDLLTGPKGPFADLENAINDAVKAYIAALPGDSSHPFVVTAPKTWKPTVWAVVMEGDGHQLPHIHPSGWLSGVYYPRVPVDMGASSEEPRGWIEFCRPQDIYAARKMPPLRLCRPE